MRAIAYRIAVIIKEAEPEHTSSIEIMQYALVILLNTLFSFFASLLIGFLLGHFKETIITFIVLAVLRMTSGGAHFKSGWACNVISIFLCVLIPLCPSLSFEYLNALIIFSLIIMVLFAPNPDPNTRLPRRLYPLLKALSIGIVALNFGLHSNVIGLASFVQSLTIIPLKREVGL